VVELGGCPGEGVRVLESPVDLDVVFAEEAKDRAALRASVRFW
jgi:hypothetical protein